MKRSLAGAAVRPKKLRLAGAIQVITCVIGANAVAALGNTSIKLPLTPLPTASEGKFCSRCPSSPA